MAKTKEKIKRKTSDFAKGETDSLKNDLENSFKNWFKIIKNTNLDDVKNGLIDRYKGFMDDPLKNIKRKVKGIAQISESRPKRIAQLILLSILLSVPPILWGMPDQFVLLAVIGPIILFSYYTNIKKLDILAYSAFTPLMGVLAGTSVLVGIGGFIGYYIFSSIGVYIGNKLRKQI